MSELVPPIWKDLDKKADLDKLISISQKKPVLLLRHKSTTDVDLKVTLENEWEITEPLDVFVVDDDKNPTIGAEICDQFEVDDFTPQVMMIVEGEVIYEECDDSISAKKIMLALRIINKTFKLMETRQPKKASG